MKKEKIIKELEKIVNSKNIIFDENELEIYNKDWRGFYNYKSICVIFPKNKSEIIKIVKFCNKRNIKIVPQAGNTSLTGASVPSQDNYEIILNFKKINKIISLDKDNLLVTVEPGVILDNLKKFVEKNNFYFPLGLSSSGSCQIGGNIGTNAGGINALKYGSIRENIQGLEIVLADGSLINTISTNKKNNTGYDIKNIFCGSEGTLGIITKALLKIYPKPEDYFHCMFSFKKSKDTIIFFKKLSGIFNSTIESAEIIPKIAINLTIKHGFLNKKFFNKDYESFLMCKFSLFENKNLFQKMFEEKINKLNHLFEDIIIPYSIQQEKNMWKFRDDLVEAYKLEGNYITNDISIPLNNMNDFTNEASAKINELVSNSRIYSFGHLGDGNIHFNIIEPINYSNNFNKYRNKIYEIVNDLVYKYEGSFSAEHGIGMIKKRSLLKYKDKNELLLMKKIKKTLDPKNIFNPGKIFDLN